MTIEHKLIADAQLHEPKGASAASVNTVFVADGSGSGAFEKVDSANIDSGVATGGQVLAADGAGGTSWVTEPGGTHGEMEIVGNVTPTPITVAATYVKVAEGSPAGDTLSGITIDVQYATPIQRDLLGAGCFLLDQKAGIVTIVHDKSTNVATANTEENGIIDLADYLKRTTRETAYRIHKNVVIDAIALSAIEGTMAGILEVEIDNQNIVEYRNLSAVQDTAEPRRVKIGGEAKPAYSLNWMDISIAFYV